MTPATARVKIQGEMVGYMDKTFVKGLSLLEILVMSGEPRGVTSLALETGMTKSNIHRLLSTLTACGYARKNRSNGGYELTSKIWELGVLVRSRLSLVKVSQPHMEELARETGESVHLSILEGLEVVYMDKIESKHPIAAYTRIGGRAPAWKVATGKAMLAYANWDEDQLTKVSGCSPQELRHLNADLETVRTLRYAVNRGEWRAEVFGIAAPIWDATHSVVGAVGISGPATRFGQKNITSWSGIVIAAADAISREMGAGTPAKAGAWQ